MQQLQEQLAAAKTLFLEQHCLLSELRDTVNCLQADKQGLKDQSHADHATHAPSSTVLDSLAKHLQAALLAQHLQLTAGQQAHQQRNPLLVQEQQPGAGADAPSGQRAELLGTAQHILGVTPQQLRQTFIPSRKAAQRNHAPVLPCLEQRLKQHAQAAAAAVTGLQPDEAAAASHVVQRVKDTAAEVSQRAQANAQQLQQLHAEAAAYVQELDSIHAVLQQLVGQCMLEEQPKIAQAAREYTAASMRNCMSKLHLMQQQLWSDTYTADNVQALTVISQELQQEEQELTSRIEQAESALAEYVLLGEDFEGVVQQYADTKGEMRKLDDLLLTLTEVEDQMVGLGASRY